MKLIILPKLCWLVLCLCLAGQLSAQAAFAPSLEKMEKLERVSSTRLTLHLSALPGIEVDHSGQRIDLHLENAVVSPSLLKLPEDDKIVKVLLVQKPDALLVSLLLRRPPNQVVTESLRGPDRVVLDLFWEGDDSARPGVAFRIADMPPKKTGKQAKEFARRSPWQDDWWQLFRSYRAAWRIEVPLTYSKPLLPPLISDELSPLWFLQQLANEEKYLSVLRYASQVDGLSEADQFKLKLLVAEAQLLSGATEAGLLRLQSLQNQERDGEPSLEQLRVDFLTAYGQALSGQSFVAQLNLQTLLNQLPDDPFRIGQLLPSIYLLAAETALASKQDKQALSYLQQKPAWPDPLLAIVEMRSADALVGVGKLAEALSIYADLRNEEGLFETYRFSCNRAGHSAFKSQDYQLARHFFRILTEQLKEQPGHDLAQFALGASAFLSGDDEWGLIGLQKASLEHPNSEGAGRAELLLTDYQLLSRKELGLVDAASEYLRLSKEGSVWAVREEATLKWALALSLLEDHEESVAGLMRFRREFSSSKLRREADLLLLEQLPILVRQHLNNGNELQAVVLVEQNRNLLLRGGFNPEFLQDLASSFERLGLYERASRVLLYMFDQSAKESQKKALYLPLARTFLKREEYARASDYASRYLKRYPRGADSAALFGLLLDAFEKQGRDEELLAWLENPVLPRELTPEEIAQQVLSFQGNLIGGDP